MTASKEPKYTVYVEHKDLVTGSPQLSAAKMSADLDKELCNHNEIYALFRGKNMLKQAEVGHMHCNAQHVVGRG
eukprot:638122-Prorocentrum_lima.AAC.1